MSATFEFDIETTISLADRFVEEDHFFLLESATAGPGGIARYSFIGFEPIWTFTVKDGDAETLLRGKREKFPVTNPVKDLEKFMGQFQFDMEQTDQRLIDGFDLCAMGGGVGYISYDVAKYIEPTIGQTPPKKLNMPELHYFMPSTFMIHDLLTRKLTIVRYVLVDQISDDQLKLRHEQECKEIEKCIYRVKQGFRPRDLQTTNDPIDFDRCEASIEKEDFLKSVNYCLEQVRAGEIFQVQIGNRLKCSTSARPFDVFRHLRILNPSPYMVFFKCFEDHIICASPEMMVNVDKKRVVHRPIAGTRRRTWDLEKDKQVKQELQDDEKERAEHVMLVDLSRNDIGRIAAPGTVKVEELMIVEEYSHVFHLVSQVSGELKPELTSFDAMSASFPNGTVSGAPKIRAMQFINELESCGREFYAGALGIFMLNGDLKSTLLIRTLHMKNGVASTQASAGIVYDSVPESEWQETRNKMAACIVAMQNTK